MKCKLSNMINNLSDVWQNKIGRSLANSISYSAGITLMFSE